MHSIGVDHLEAIGNGRKRAEIDGGDISSMEIRDENALDGQELVGNR